MVLSSATPRALARKQKRDAAAVRQQERPSGDGGTDSGAPAHGTDSDNGSFHRMFVDEQKLFTFMHDVNEIYQDLLKQPPPFARYILLGLQSTGKSTQVERLLKFPMNIVAEGTGTRCPLYVSCLMDPSVQEAQCTLSGCERCLQSGPNPHFRDVFNRVTIHNREHVDGFSSEPLRLMVRSRHVQNMFFVDLPGIITTKGQGEDKRKAIKDILKKEIKVENTKLLVLLEPKEYSTNSIVDFVDETLGKREAWIDKTLFLMTKFDLRAVDSLTGAKTNRFLDEFWGNNIQPFMVITPTMQRSADSMSAEEQYDQRQELLSSASTFESEKFEDWMGTMQDAFMEDPRAEEFNGKFVPYIGFSKAVAEMNRLLLKDTQERLPQVIGNLSSKREQAAAQLESLREEAQFADERQIQLRMAEVIRILVERIAGYLDGDLRVAQKLPKLHQQLADEIQGEEDSDWAPRKLNHLNEAEEEWRDHIAVMAEKESWPSSVQIHGKFLGGKQYQRALNFFKTVMVDRLPDPNDLRPYVSTALGTLRGGLQHEDWEHATVEIIKTSVRKVSEAGINYFVKHALYIFRRLLLVALEDVKSSEASSSMFQHMPHNLQEWMIQQYDKMLWDIGLHGVKFCHQVMEPFYSTVNPSLPTMSSKTTEAPELKAGWSQFSNHLSQNKVQQFYHFTDKRNWEKIRHLGGLYSWMWLADHGHEIPAPGGDDLSRGLDKKRGVADFVHLSFCKDHPMLHAAQKDGRIKDCVVLAIDPIVATWKDTLFSDVCAIKTGANIGPNMADLAKVNIACTLCSRADAKDPDAHQAEVMVKQHVPLQYITVEGEVPLKTGMLGQLAQAVQDSLPKVIPPVKISMKMEAENGALQRKEFLPSARTGMTCNNEVSIILNKSYEYIVGLWQFISVILEFQFNHFLFVEFKSQLPKRMGFELISGTDWKALAGADPTLAKHMEELSKQIEALDRALATVRQIQTSAPC